MFIVDKTEYMYVGVISSINDYPLTRCHLFYIVNLNVRTQQLGKL